MGSKRTKAGVASLLAVALVGCGDRVTSDDARPGAGGSVASTSTTAALPPEAQPAQATPESAAQGLLDAWAAGDRAAAALVGEEQVVDALFASGLDPKDVLFRGCREDPELRCIALLPANRQITFTVRTGTPMVVTAVVLPPAAP